MKIWKFLAITGAVLTVGAGVFLFTRPAAAAAAGRKGFKVNAECTELEIVDEEAAREALTAAAMVNYKGMSGSASELLVLTLGSAIPQCPINDYLKIKGIPGVPFGLTVGQIKAIIGDRTVEQVAELAAKGELPGFEMPVGASEEMGATPGETKMPRHPVAALLAWTTGGEYPQ